MNNKSVIYKYLIFEFLIFFSKNCDIGLLWSKITIFMIEITRKLLLLTKYGWNNPSWGRFCLKSPKKLHFFAISDSSKFIAYTDIQIHVAGSIFIVIWFFLTARNNVLYQNQEQLKLPKMLITESMIPLYLKKQKIKCYA